MLDIAFKLRGLTSGALLGGLLLAVFWRKGSSTPVVIGMVVSLIVMAYLSPLVQAAVSTGSTEVPGQSGLRVVHDIRGRDHVRQPH